MQELHSELAEVRRLLKSREEELHSERAEARRLRKLVEERKEEEHEERKFHALEALPSPSRVRPRGAAPAKRKFHALKPAAEDSESKINVLEKNYAA